MGVVDTGGVATTPRRPRALPFDVVDLNPPIKEALSRVPSVQVGPDCALEHSGGHARWVPAARRAVGAARGFAAAGVAHLG